MGLNLYKIRDMALESKRAVYSTQMLANLICKEKTIANVYLNRLVQKGLAQRLVNGKISFIDDTHVIATQFVEPSYISFNSALLIHGLITQVPKSVECATPINSISYPRLGIKYHKISQNFFYGYKKHSKSSSYIFLAEPQKAILDCIYLNKITKSTFLDLLHLVDRSKLDEYAKRFSGRGSKKIMRWLDVE